MNRKRIQEHLKAKFDDWVNSITDKKVQAAVRHGSIITGGCIVSLLTGEPVNDYDVYFTDEETTYTVAKYYVDIFNKDTAEQKNRLGYKHKAMVLRGGNDAYIQDQIKEQGEWSWNTGMLQIPAGRVKIVVRSDGVKGNDKAVEDEDGPIAPSLNPERIMTDMDDIDYDKECEPPVPKKDEKTRKKYQPKFLTTNAVTLTDKIQCTVRFYGTPEEIHKNYDFVHCTNYWTSYYNQLVLHAESLEAILDKRLIYQGSLYPLSSIIRIRKFIQKGWKINAGQLLKMCFQLSKINLSDIHKLEDQLMGVDTMYFFDLIERLKEQQKHAPEGTIDQEYVCTLVDKIFG